MPKKFNNENTKVTKANEKKAAAQAEKDAKKAKEKAVKEDAEWAVGSKNSSKKEEEERKRQEALRKKAEAARLLEEETKEFSKKAPILKTIAKGEEKKALKKTLSVEAASAAASSVPEFSATNIDDALDLLSISNDKTAIGGGNSAKDIERHPERRFKAALAAYEEREMPKLKQENPGLRFNQYKELLYKNFQKSPDNPFNQGNVVNYNAEKEDEAQLIQTRRKEIESRLQN